MSDGDGHRRGAHPIDLPLVVPLLFGVPGRDDLSDAARRRCERQPSVKGNDSPSLNGSGQ